MKDHSLQRLRQSLVGVFGPKLKVKASAKGQIVRLLITSTDQALRVSDVIYPKFDITVLRGVERLIARDDRARYTTFTIQIDRLALRSRYLPRWQKLEAEQRAKTAFRTVLQ